MIPIRDLLAAPRQAWCRRRSSLAVRRARRILAREHAVLHAPAELRRTRADWRIKVRKRDHLAGSDHPQPSTVHDVWLERDTRWWWQPRWCWWLGCQRQHGYSLTRWGARRALVVALRDHECAVVTR